MPVLLTGGANVSRRRAESNTSQPTPRSGSHSVAGEVIDLLRQVEAKVGGERDIEAESALFAQIPRLVVWLSRRAAGEVAQIEQVRSGPCLGAVFE